MPSQEVTKNAQKSKFKLVATVKSCFPSVNLSKVVLSGALGSYAQTSSSISNASANAEITFRAEKGKQVSYVGMMSVNHNFITSDLNADTGNSLYIISLKIINENGTAPGVVGGTQVDVTADDVPNQIKKWLMAGKLSAEAPADDKIAYSYGTVTGTTWSCMDDNWIWSRLNKNNGDFTAVYTNKISAAAKNEPNITKH